MRKPLPILTNIQVEKIVHGGQALAHVDGKPLFFWGALPGEIVDVQVTRKNSKIREGIVVRVHSAAQERVAPAESHWMSCSPWQILSSATEQAWKMQLAQEVYVRAGITHKLQYEESVAQEGYRNKIEWSFALNDHNEISLAFFGRGTHTRCAVESCILASPTIRRVSDEIVQWIREQKIPLRSLKSMIVRSNARNEAIVGLFLKDELTYQQYPDTNAVLRGFHVYYSSHRSPASVVHGVLYSRGEETLMHEVGGVSLVHGLHGFFQVNVPIFERAVECMATYVLPNKPIIDAYGGVGSIGIPLARRAGVPLTIIESHAESTTFAEQNIRHAGIQGAVYTGPTERMLEHIVSDATVIVDPPRAGLDVRVIERLLEVQPKRILYLSCNIVTQARDIALLHKYRVVDARVYNFFPHTPHSEGLCVLDRVDV